MDLFLSYFCTGSELPARLSFFWTSYTLANISGALLGYGILRMSGIHGWEGCRYLFLIEGAMTAAIGIFSFFWLPPSPAQTKGIPRGKNGWFTEKEEIIMVNRILRDDPSKGDMHNRQAPRLSDFWASIKDYDNWGLHFIGICVYIPGYPPSNYLTLTLRNIGFSTLNTNLLTIPANVLFIIINSLLLAQIMTVAQSHNHRTLTARKLAHIWALVTYNIILTSKGNKVLNGVTGWNIVLFSLVKLYYVQRSKWKAARWNEMTTKDKVHYLETTSDKGNKRLGRVL
ncbi:unnamed protein product, partial [Rhizoctonia solani]